MLTNLENSAVATGLEKVCFHSNIKERQSQRKFKLSYNCIHFHMSARLGSKSFKLSFSSMRTENFEMYKLDLENTEEPEIKFSTSVAHRKSKGIPKSIYFCFIDYTKALDCVDHEMGIPGHLTCLLRNLYAGQEATVRTLCGTIDWFKRGKGVQQGCLLSPCLFNLYVEHKHGLDELQAGIKIGERSNKHLRYADDTTLMAENEEELKSLDEGEGGE